jgi:hypothetical protein
MSGEARHLLKARRGDSKHLLKARHIGETKHLGRESLDDARSIEKVKAWQYN